MGLVAPLLAAEVDLLIASRRPREVRSVTAALPRLEALHAGPGFHQRAIDREVIRRQKLLDVGLRQDRRQELGGDLAFEQTVPVLREHRVIPDRIVDAEPDEPAEQQIELQPLHQLALRADRVERLQQRGSQQLLRRDRGAGPAARTSPQSPRSGPTARHSTISRIARSGWSFGTRVSRSTYENSDPERSSVPRIPNPSDAIPAPRKSSTTREIR